MISNGNCFVGMEAEGPHKGKPTLFVPGSVGVDQLKKVYDHLMQNHKEVSNIYYGAGEDRSHRVDTWMQIKGICMSHRKIFLCEYYSPPHKVFVIDHNCNTLYEKLVTSWHIHWVQGSTVWTTCLNDPLFNTDKEIIL